MTIKFKDVGQGDSILVTWLIDDKLHVGIIDCNIHQDKTNPLLLELSSMAIETIDFIFLSHPHYDHYSGLEELLIYCASKKIIIEKFFHTCSPTEEFLRASVSTPLEDQTLASLWARIDALEGSIIQSIAMINEASGATTLDGKWKFVVLAPAYREQQDFNALRISQPKAAYKSNLLSTIIKIYSPDAYILLTSDAEHKTFKRILMHRMHAEFSKLELLLGQVSHHGAEANFHEKFWKNQKHNKLSPMAISVGPNHYGHPSANVISKLQSHNFKVDVTMLNSSAVSTALSSISTLAPGSTSNDLTYSF